MKASEEDLAPQARILLVNLGGHGFGGLETHVLNLHKHLAARGHRPLLLLAAGSEFHKRIAREGLDYHALWGRRLRGFRHLFPYVFAVLCKKHRIRAIHCNNRFELPGAIRVARRVPCKVIFNYHVADPFETKILQGIDSFVAPNRAIVGYVRERNETEHLGIRQACVLPPIFDAEKFLSYRSNGEPGRWFHETFGIHLKPCPVICSIGNMVPDLEHKNYPLLFQAMASLIHGKNIPVQAVLLGDGPVRPLLEQLGRTLNIQDHLHFLGYSAGTIPGVLHHSDTFVLASNKEAFGIVYLEAALMRKPAIGARATGAESIILHDKTGLLFDNGDAASLAGAIEKMLKDADRARSLGCQAYEHVMHQFAPSVVIRQYEALYGCATAVSNKNGIETSRKQTKPQITSKLN